MLLNCASSQSDTALPSGSSCHSHCMFFQRLGIHCGYVSVHTCQRFSWEDLCEKTFDKALVCNRGLEQLLGVPLSKLACGSGTWQALSWVLVNLIILL